MTSKKAGEHARNAGTIEQRKMASGAVSGDTNV
jgi:hypothetical protein